MSGPRDIEPLPVGPALALATGLATTTGGAFVASGIVFVVVLVTGIIGEEAYSLPSVFDAMLRALMGGVLVVTGAALLVELLRGIVERRMRLRAAERRHALAAAPRVPVVEARRLREDPYGGVMVLAWFAVVLGPVTALVDLVTGFDYDGIALLAGVGITLAAVGLFALRGWLGRRWEARVKRLPGPGGGARMAHPRPAGAKRREGRWAAAGFALQLGAYVFFAGVLLRQPCRDCDPVDYGGGPIEGVIDALVSVGGVLILIPIALLLLSTVPFLVRTAVLERRTLRAAREGALSPSADVDAQLTGAGALSHLASGLTVIGFLLVILGATPWTVLANDSAGDDDIATLAAFQPLLAPGWALIAAGLAAGIAGVVETRARRAAIHRALPRYDVGVAAEES